VKGRMGRAIFSIVVAFAAILAGSMHAPPLLVFILAALSIVLLAQWIGIATESVSSVLGPSIGALLGATFGNSVELIIAVLALKDGLYTVVKASIMGSILANLLLTLGICMMVGGLRKSVQQFSSKRAGVNSVMLFLAVTGLTITSIAALLHPSHADRTEALSLGVAILFVIVYVLGFFFSLRTHRSFLANWEVPQEKETPVLSVPQSAAILGIATVLVAFVSDQLVSAVEPLGVSFGLSQQFIGLIIIPLIGIAPEFFAAVMLARQSKMDGSVEIAVGSSLQIALFVAPILVLVGQLSGHPLTLVFPLAQVIVIFLSTFLVTLVSLDGETHWYEGVMVTATYLIFALLFYFE